MTKEQLIQQFMGWWAQCQGYENGEAQIFLDRLFQAFGHEGAMQAGGKFEDPVKRRQHNRQTTAFADFVIPGLVLIEMKKRGEDLRRHYQQAFEYWTLITPHPKYMILCNFDEFWVYDLDYQLFDPIEKLNVADLPKRAEPLAFLFPKNSPAYNFTPHFNNNLIAATQNAAQSLSLLFRDLIKQRNGRVVERDQAQQFVLQCMMAMFAEDVGLLPPFTFTKVVEDCFNGRDSAELITALFHAMNYRRNQSGGRFRAVPYFNGGIFAQIPPISLSVNELERLREIAAQDWSKIRPAIFGTVFEKSLDEAERHQFGAQYTTERDIMRIVQPVIVRPWQAQIHNAASVEELYHLQEALRHYQILDPACGSGNFLYIAYREMKRLEKMLLDRIAEATGTTQTSMGLVTARQFWGFDINLFAVELAKVALMIGKKLAVDELGLPENPLPLDNLDANFKATDALFTEWPVFDACIGNPPYLGAKRLKEEHPVQYVNRLHDAFPEIPGNADYCVYWFHKAHTVMRDGTRAGLVGTNTIRQNYSRMGGLDFIVENGGQIFEAVDSLEWSGEANVHISIACWSKGEAPFQPAKLWTNNGTLEQAVGRISSSLSAKTDVSSAQVLRVNTTPKRMFQGQTPGHDGFVLSREEAYKLVQNDLFSKEVIFPYLTGDDLLSQPQAKPRRWIIDFGESDQMTAKAYHGAYQHIEARVFPDRKAKADEQRTTNKKLLEENPKLTVNQHHLHAFNRWWLHIYGRGDFRQTARKLSRFIVCSRISKRPVFEFISPRVVISDKVQAFLFEDDYSFGILHSRWHWEWWVAKGATLTERPAYTTHSVFDTFPWPQKPKPKHVKKVAEVARQIQDLRWDVMKRNHGERGLTLREMYALLDKPSKNPLRDLHTALDKAVREAYGFDKEGDMLAQLLALNGEVFAKIEAGEAVTPPGLPENYPDKTELVSAGCIQPPEMI